MPQSATKAKWLFGLILLIGFFQCTRSIDFKDYYLRTQGALADGFLHPPYPVGTAIWGDFFQSPLVVLLLSPLTRLPFPIVKFLWALGNALGVVYVLRRTVATPLNLKATFFFVLIFAHGLSDVFLSGNINLSVLVLCTAGWYGLNAGDRRRQCLGGLALALAILIKVQPLIFVAWWILRREWQRVGWILLGLGTWLAFSWLILPSGGFAGWWGGWLQSLSLYPMAAHPGHVSHQSPPAAFFRLLRQTTPLSVSAALAYTSALAFAIQGSLLLLALRRNAFPLLLASFFLGGPFSWALTTLFLFPLFYEAFRDEIPGAAWATAIFFSAIPKAFWPPEVWQKIAEGNLPALCFIVLTGISLFRLDPPLLRAWGFNPTLRPKPRT